jgi:hypothetical protein
MEAFRWRGLTEWTVGVDLFIPFGRILRPSNPYSIGLSCCIRVVLLPIDFNESSCLNTISSVSNVSIGFQVSQ